MHQVGDDLIGRVCASCGDPLADGRSLVWDGMYFYHGNCHRTALMQFTIARKLSAISMAISQYVATRPDI